MDMRAKIEFLKSAIASQQVTLHLQIALAAMLFVLGITVVILSFVNPGLILAQTLKTGQRSRLEHDPQQEQRRNSHQDEQVPLPAGAPLTAAVPQVEQAGLSSQEIGHD